MTEKQSRINNNYKMVPHNNKNPSKSIEGDQVIFGES